jgi:DNA polymerase beta
MNSLIIKELTTLGQTEKEAGNKFKSAAYFKAVKAIKELKEDLTSGTEAQQLPGIGKSIGAKIEEIITTKKLQRNIDESKDEKKTAIKFLQSIHGIGPVKAKELYAKYHITNLTELKKHKDVLDEQQLIGLKYHKEFKQKIPREEMRQIIALLEYCRDKVDEELIITVCGSYRRGKAESGDIDVLVTRRDWKSGERPDSMGMYIKLLKKCKLLTDELAYGEKKLMGVCCLSDELLGLDESGVEYIHRRIDIRFIPYEGYYAGILYFTGSGEFNVRMRQKALDQGYTLNEYRICKLSEPDVTIRIRSEKEIFEVIGMEYVSPKNRD